MIQVSKFTSRLHVAITAFNDVNEHGDKKVHCVERQVGWKYVTYVPSRPKRMDAIRNNNHACCNEVLRTWRAKRVQPL